MFQTESQNYDHPQYFTQSHEIYGERPTLKRQNKQATTKKNCQKKRHTNFICTGASQKTSENSKK